MQDQVFRAQHERALDLAAKRFNGLFEKRFRDAREVNEVIRMDHHRLQVIFLAQTL